MDLYPSLLPVFDKTGHEPAPILAAALEAQRAGVAGLHLDFMAPPTMPRHTFTPALVGLLRQGGVVLPLDVHLMTPARWIEDMDLAAIQSLTFHPKGAKDAEEIAYWFAYMQDFDLGYGLAFDVDENPADYAPFLLYPRCTHALVMTVQAGAGGQAFNPEMLHKIKTIQAIRPDMHIMVDGGINAASWPVALGACAHAAVAGSAVFNEQPVENNIKRLMGQG